MPKTFDILKKRWPEVAFIVFLYSLPNLTSTIIMQVHNWRLMSGNGNTHNLQQLMWATPILSLIIGALLIFLNAGFLRTAYLYGKQIQGLGTLLKTGAPFFIQFFIVSFIYQLIMKGAISINALIMQRVGYENYKPYSWVFMLVMLIIAIALLKLRLFIPSLIIVCKLNVITAFKELKYYRLLAAKETLMLFATSYLLGTVGSLLWGGIFRLGFIMVYHIGFLILHFILNLFSLAIMLSAVKFIDDNTETASQITGEQVE